jgi:hypothetical protein
VASKVNRFSVQCKVSRCHPFVCQHSGGTISDAGSRSPDCLRLRFSCASEVESGLSGMLCAFIWSVVIRAGSGCAWRKGDGQECWRGWASQDGGASLMRSKERTGSGRVGGT